jgi:predicted phosphate transport protein (TIGR00153 family)
MRFRLMPREDSFFDLLEKASQNLDRASKLLVESLRNPENLSKSATQMKLLEESGDKIVHEIMAKLHSTFITPLDREDIHDLISALDDVLDYMEAAMDRFTLYRAQNVTPQALELAEITARQASQIHEMIPLLRHITRESILPHCVEINRLENVADSALRSGLEELFAAPADALHVIKWRELYELLEAATDKAEDVADVVEGIVLKNA